MGSGIVRKYFHPCVWQLMLTFSWDLGFINWSIHVWPVSTGLTFFTAWCPQSTQISPVAAQCSEGKMSQLKSWKMFYYLASKATQPSFCYFVLIANETQICPGPKEGSTDSTSRWIKCQGHMAEEHVGWEI